MCDRPCGCSARIDAEREIDPDGRAEKLRLADEFARDWRCPIAAGEQRFGALGDADEALTRETLDRIGRLTGCDLSDVRTCPVALTYDADVHRAMRAWKWREKGALQYVEPNPPAVLLAAVDEISEAVESCRLDVEKRRLKAMQDKARNG